MAPTAAGRCLVSHQAHWRSRRRCSLAHGTSARASFAGPGGPQPPRDMCRSCLLEHRMGPASWARMAARTPGDSMVLDLGVGLAGAPLEPCRHHQWEWLAHGPTQ